jgi:hypothetical protein
MFGTIKQYVVTLTVALIFTNQIISQSSNKVWFIQSGGQGDGLSSDHPMGNLSKLNNLTKPKDLIILLPSDLPLSGGFSLKDGQQLIGIQENGQSPTITNTDSTRLGGNGIVLANNNQIKNIIVENTFASGIFGRNVSGVRIDQVKIKSTNQSRKRTDFELSQHGELPHGGIIFIQTNDISSINHIVDTDIVAPIGASIGHYSSSGTEQILRVQDSHVLGGSAVVPPFDCGILAVGVGEGTQSILELSGSKINGRMSGSGRNVLILADSKASAKAHLVRTVSGEVGQDGVLAVVNTSPAQVSITIEDCMLEKAMTNIEGTIVNFPPYDSLKANEAKVSINVIESIVRDARVIHDFGNDNVRSGNIVIGSSPLTPRPLPTGNYQLSIINSRIENGRGYGLYIGLLSEEWESSPESSSFDIHLRNNIFTNNGEAELILSAINAKIDAKQNCWNIKGGISNDHIIFGDGSTISQLDISEPLLCND